MGFNSYRGRKPFELASKTGHIPIINQPSVQNILNNCVVPDFSDDGVAQLKGWPVDFSKAEGIKHIVSVDGGYAEASVKNGFPSASIAFFNFGALMFELEDLKKVDECRIINPDDLKKLKEINKIALALPAMNVLLKGCESFSHSVRKTIYDFFDNSDIGAVQGESLLESLQWLVFESWDQNKPSVNLEFCPYEDCPSTQNGDKIVQSFSFPKQKTIICSRCNREIYFTDYFRLHEIISEPSGARGLFGYLTSVIEQMLIVQIIKFIYENNREMLSRVAFIKDGPLAFFGQTFRLHDPMRKLMRHLSSVPTTQGTGVINLVGIEKSGPFVEHALKISNELQKNHFYIFDTAYIKKYIAPTSQDTYGKNTYYGSKVIYKTESDDVLVVSIPVKNYASTPSVQDLISIDVMLTILSQMKCNMYENSLVPVTLINKLVSISEVPSIKILEKFANKKVGRI